MTQRYALTGKTYRPDYVGAINVKKRYLPEKKRLKDEEEYRDKVLALREKEITQTEGLAKEKLAAEKESSLLSSGIGLAGVMGETYYGRKRDTALREMLAGEGGAAAKDAVAPTVSGAVSSTPWGEIDPGAQGIASAAKAIPGATVPKTGFVSGLKTGASKAFPIASSALAGGAIGSQLGERIIGGEAGKIIGGGLAAGGLGYLATGDLYSAGLSLLFGAGIGGFFG